MLPHVAGRDMARVDRCLRRSEQIDKGGLRSLQVEGYFEIAIGADPLQVAVPRFAGIDAQLVARLIGQEVPRALDVLGGKWLPVVPFDTLPQRKGQLGAILAPRPAGGEI